jgi:hypothetical protein
VGSSFFQLPLPKSNWLHRNQFGSEVNKSEQGVLARYCRLQFWKTLEDRETSSKFRSQSYIRSRVTTPALLKLTTQNFGVLKTKIMCYYILLNTLYLHKMSGVSVSNALIVRLVLGVYAQYRFLRFFRNDCRILTYLFETQVYRRIGKLWHLSTLSFDLGATGLWIRKFGTTPVRLTSFHLTSSTEIPTQLRLFVVVHTETIHVITTWIY